MKFSKLLSPFVIAAIVFGFAAPMASAASFSEPKVAKVYAKIVLATDKKVAKLRSISADDRAKITAARANLEKAFVAVDAAFKKPSDRQRSVNQLVRAYSDLNVLIAAIAKNPAQPVPAATVQTVAPAAVTQSVVGKLSTEAQILYYSDDFENSGTSGGDRFNQSAYSAARCAVDLGRLIQVANGSKSVVVKVNDRPSCSKHPDIVDLTTTAFQSLAPLSKGRISGSFEVLGWSPSGYRKEAIATAGFSDLGVKFDANIPNTYLPGETLRISGIVTDGKEDTVLFLKSPTGKKYSRSLPVDGNVFSYEIPLLEVGKYDLVVASGMGFSTNKTQPIYVLSDDALAGKKTLSSTPVSMSVNELRFVRKESSDLTPLNVLDLPSIGKKALRTVKISQEGKSDLVRRSMGDVAFYP
ncbi:MAG: septal ring lytic transglycosylase RlpA family protein, partial [Patescibacteria group bacterium]